MTLTSVLLLVNLVAVAMIVFTFAWSRYKERQAEEDAAAHTVPPDGGES